MRWEERITINAPAGVILDVLTGLERWPEWNPAAKSVHLLTAGPLRIGSEAEVSMDGTPTSTFRVTSLDATGFAWSTRVRGIDTIADHRIEQLPNGACEVTLSVEMHGLMATLFRPLVARTANRNIPREAAGLKHRAESLIPA
ncbi:MAG: SRPBCC family protein [Dehalococcoidia bacterium]|nr:SRPBCC family protein [Dehalococcoidia bacterium]